MWKMLTAFGDWLLQGSVRSALTGAGLGLGTSLVSITLVQQYIDKVVSSGNSVESDVLGLLALSGVDVALSSIIGAVIYKMTVSSTKLSLMRKKA